MHLEAVGVVRGIGLEPDVDAVVGGVDGGRYPLPAEPAERVGGGRRPVMELHEVVVTVHVRFQLETGEAQLQDLDR